MKEIKKIDTLSTGKVFGILYAFIGLIFGLFITFFSLIGLAISPDSSGLIAILFGVGAILLLPLFYGVLGFITGLISALLYNIVVKFVGGIKIEIS